MPHDLRNLLRRRPRVSRLLQASERPGSHNTAGKHIAGVDSRTDSTYSPAGEESKTESGLHLASSQQKSRIMRCPFPGRFIPLLCFRRVIPFLLVLGIAPPLYALQVDPPSSSAEAEDTEAPTAPEKVEVDPLSQDSDIAERLTRILRATERFQNPSAEVDEGVAFLSGTTRREEYRKWAGDLARNTRDVVAVVNRIEVDEGSIWDLSPAWAEIRRMTREVIQSLPLIGLALLLLLATWLIARAAMWAAEIVLERRISNRLLRDVTSRAVAIPIFLLGVYLILRISGLTQIAATVLGGTGLIGLVIGIAFRDIAENFLASILISLQRPFSIGDLVRVEGFEGFVQSVTTRGTLLMTLDGNHVQIPNATIYKAVIHNFTANPRTRLHFTVGIGYDDSVTEAQDVALQTLRDHPVVLEEPEPLVLVNELGASTVNLHVYFWIDGHEHSMPKARSSVIRLVKRAFEKSGISMPDEAREVVFPRGVPIVSPDADDARPLQKQATQEKSSAIDGRDDEIRHDSEGDLTSEADTIKQQAAMSRQPDASPNLLENPAPGG